MKKIFKAEYGNELAKQISEWVEEQTLSEERGCKIYRPTAVVEIFDQCGDEIKEEL